MEKMTIGDYLKTVTSEVIAPVAGLCLVVGGIGFLARSCSNPEIPLDTRQKLQEEVILPFGHPTGVRINALENGRTILFYDHGWDGNLDEVGITRGFGPEYSTTDQEELKKWQSEYERIRKQRAGKFVPRFKREYHK